LPEGYCGENSENTLRDLFLLVLQKPVHNSLGDGEKNGSQYVSENQRKKMSSSECNNKGKAMKKNCDNNEDVARNKQRVYVVKSTDTLRGIARRFYHDPETWRRIAEANGIENPRLLTAGIILNIPALDE
jgi:nucleoid-associated protein YgaU